jgi:uncharacterized membrane protein
MIQFEVSVLIDKPIDIVFQAYVDPDNMLKWSTDLERFEIIEGQPGKIGSHARLHYNENGRKSILDDRLVEYKPKEKIVSSVSGGGLIANVETLFNSKAPSKTEIILKWKGTSKKLTVKLALTFLQKKIKKRANSELKIFKKLVETYGTKFEMDSHAKV